MCSSDLGKILAGGDFTAINGQTCHRVGRLNPDGSFDAGFNPGADGGVRALAVQTDGAIVVGGDFTSFGGQARRPLARFSRCPENANPRLRGGSHGSGQGGRCRPIRFTQGFGPGRSLEAERVATPATRDPNVHPIVRERGGESAQMWRKIA